MADHTITADQTGAYEIPLPAGTLVTVNVTSRYPGIVYLFQVNVHDGSAPIYAKPTPTVTVKDPTATVIAPGMWADIRARWEGTTGTLALISAEDATVSVIRS